MLVPYGTEEPRAWQSRVRSCAGVLGILIVSLGIVSADVILGLLASDPKVHNLGTLYLVTLLAFYPFEFISDTLENALIGGGRRIQCSISMER